MGGGQGRGYGDLAQRANPQMSDPMQNINNQGLPRGRNIMGGAQGGAPGPGGAPVGPGMPRIQPGPMPPGGGGMRMDKPAPPGGLAGGIGPPRLTPIPPRVGGGMTGAPPTGGLTRAPINPGQALPPAGGPIGPIGGAPQGAAGAMQQRQQDIGSLLAQGQGPGALPGGPQLPPNLAGAFGGRGPAGPGAGPTGK